MVFDFEELSQQGYRFTYYHSYFDLNAKAIDFVINFIKYCPKKYVIVRLLQVVRFINFMNRGNQHVENCQLILIMPTKDFPNFNFISFGLIDFSCFIHLIKIIIIWNQYHF